MRVALDVSAAIHQTAGIARYCVELARSLQATAADGDEIALFYVGDGPSPRLASLGDPLPHGGRGDRLDRESRETTRQARIEGPPATRRVFSLSRLSRRFGSFRGPNVSPLPPSGRGAGGEGAFLSPLPPDLARLPALPIALPTRRWRLQILLARALGRGCDALVPGADLFHGADHILPPLQRVPAVVTIHDLTFLTHPQFHQPLNRWYLRLAVPAAIRQARAIVVDARATADEIARRYGIDGDRIHVIPLAAPSHFRPEPDPRRQAAAMARYGVAAPFIFYVGTIEPRKNLSALLRAYEQMPAASDGSKPLLVVGGTVGWQAQPFLDAVARSPERRRILLPGRIADDDLPALLSACSAFVFPSIAEGFGFPVLEALACGAPVVTSNTSSLPEVAGDAALYADPARPESIAAALAGLLSAPATADRLRRAGPTRAAEFSWERTARETWEVYRECAVARRGSPGFEAATQEHRF